MDDVQAANRTRGSNEPDSMLPLRLLFFLVLFLSVLMKGKRERKEREGKEIKKLIERFSRVFPMLFESVFTSWLSFIFLFFFGRQQAKKTEKGKRRGSERDEEERRSNMILGLIRLSIEFGAVSLFAGCC